MFYYKTLTVYENHAKQSLQWLLSCDSYETYNSLSLENVKQLLADARKN